MVCGQDEYTLQVNVDDPNIELQWYFNDDPIPGATTNSLTIDESGLYRIDVTSGDCSASDEVNVIFGDLQVNGTEFTIEVEDVGGDGTENFDLTDVQPMAVDDQTGIVFVYYATYEDAESQNSPITNPTNYPATDGTTVYARLHNADGCYEIIEIHLELIVDCIDPQPVCADEDYGVNIPFLNDGEIPEEAPPGPEYDCLGSQPYPRFFYFKSATAGSLNFYLNQYTEPDQGGEGIDVDFIVWGPFEEVPCDYNDLQEVVSCSFSADYEEYVTVPNAEVGDIFVMMVTDYAGSYGEFGYVNLIFDDENSTGTFDCTILGLAEFSDCDNDGDGQVQFDLDAIATDLAEEDDTLDITFYSTEEDATDDTGNNIINSPFTVDVADSPVVIYAQVKDENGNIQEIISVTLSIFEGVTGTQNVSFSTCDVGNDGTEVIDLTQFDVIANPDNYTITYYEDEQEAMDGNATYIPNPATYEASTGTIYVRIENENGCFAIAEINLDISGLEVDLGEDFSMCEGEFTLTASGDFSGFTDVTYTWQRNGDVLDGETSNTLVIDEIGQYKVTVNTAEGCSGSDTVNVLQGEAPVITAITVGPDFVIVDATGGVLPYQYSITGEVWQDSNQFNNLPAGIYTMYVKTAEGCVTTQEFAVFFMPTMFTPNGDGINDTWNIPGMEIYPGSNVVVYDRQGRLVYQADLNSNTIWDGFYMNGQKAPTQDYWYIINVTDGRKLTGHITVKSRGEKN
jgi:gliding motility-associated-like protein